MPSHSRQLTFVLHPCTPMNVQVFLPSERLRPFISTFMIIESKDGMLNTILPDIHMTMAFCFKGKVLYKENNGLQASPPAAITGLRKTARLLQYEKGTATLLVKFTEAGAMAFLPAPPSALFDHTVALEQVIPHHKAVALCEQLAEAEHHLQRIALVESTLIALLNGRYPDPLVQAAMDAIKLSAGSIRIRELATSLYISQDPFEKRFRQATGTSPKHFAEIVRLRSLIKDASSFRNLGSAAHAFGFFDQAHFIRSFKAFTGQTPKVFFQTARYW